jgi:hypothetical protein
MARTMYDSVTARDIPRDPDLVAGYVDGLFAWSASDWQQFPVSVHVGISVNPDGNVGQVLDVEAGNATPQQAIPWIQRRRASGSFVSIYIAHQSADALAALLIPAGLGDVPLWIVDATGAPHLWPNSTATQYAVSSQTGGHYDASLVADHWPGVDSAPPVPLPIPVPVSGAVAADMFWTAAAGLITSTLPDLNNRVAVVAGQLGAL